MSKKLIARTLNLVDQLLFRARNLQQHGQTGAAARLLTRLVGLRRLPADVAEEVQVRLAEVHLETGQHAQARRHLSAALARQPDCAHYHYLLAAAVEDDPRCDAQRAGEHYRRCLALDDEHVDYLCDYALYALREGKTRVALTALRRAAPLAADDADALGRVAAGLRKANKPDEAKALLRTALFRNPRDRRFRSLWEQHQFDLLHQSQQPRPTVNDVPPVILPFRRPRKRPQQVGGKIVRTDGPSRLTGPTILPMHVARKQDA